MRLIISVWPDHLTPVCYPKKLTTYVHQHLDSIVLNCFLHSEQEARVQCASFGSIKHRSEGQGDIAQQLPGRILWTHLQEVLEKTKALWQSKWVIVTVVGWLQWLCVPQNSEQGLGLTHWDNKTHPSWVGTCIPIWVPFIFFSKQTEPLNSCSRSLLTFLLKQLGHLNLPWCHQRT